MNQTYIMKTLAKNGTPLKSEIWDSSAPYVLGHPFQWIIEKTQKGYQLHDLISLSVKELMESDLISGILLPSGMQLKLSRTTPANSSAMTSYLPLDTYPEAEEWKDFLNKIKIFGGAFLVALTLIKVIPLPKSESEPLVPPQFAKIILAKPKADHQSKGEKQADSGKAAVGTVIQAFKSAQVQKATQSLLKSGVLSTLAKSSFSSSRTAAAASSLFRTATGSVALSNIGVSKKDALAVGMMGGGAANGGGGPGYGNGERASVQGQGESFVSLNTQDVVIEEGLTRDEIGKVIHSHLVDIRYCYESAMVKNPDLQGKLVIDFVIDGTSKNKGSVKSAKVGSSTITQDQLNQCIISKLVKWKFPSPKGNTDVAVTYPFIFKALGK